MTARWLRQPLVHFIAIGGCLFAVDRAVPHPARSDRWDGEGVTITGQRISELRRDWVARTGQLPSAAELDALIERATDEELLLREARRRGFHRSDPLVRRRLLRNMRFVSRDGGGDADALVREALALGMDRTDLVVRRRLIQKLELAAFASARAHEPSESELREFLAGHAERFSEPARVRLSHVYLDRQRRGDDLAADAKALLARLSAGPVAPEVGGALGDPFLAGSTLPPLSERELAKRFGPDFARAALALEIGAWTGPLPSSYGQHLVWVHGRSPALPSTLESVHGEVREALLAERGAAALRTLLSQLGAETAVHVARPPPETADAAEPQFEGASG